MISSSSNFVTNLIFRNSSSAGLFLGKTIEAFALGIAFSGGSRLLFEFYDTNNPDENIARDARASYSLIATAMVITSRAVIILNRPIQGILSDNFIGRFPFVIAESLLGIILFILLIILPSVAMIFITVVLFSIVSAYQISVAAITDWYVTQSSSTTLIRHPNQPDNEDTSRTDIRNNYDEDCVIRAISIFYMFYFSGDLVGVIIGQVLPINDSHGAPLHFGMATGLLFVSVLFLSRFKEVPKTRHIPTPDQTPAEPTRLIGVKTDDKITTGVVMENAGEITDEQDMVARGVEVAEELPPTRVTCCSIFKNGLSEYFKSVSILLLPPVQGPHDSSKMVRAFCIYNCGVSVLALSVFAVGSMHFSLSATMLNWFLLYVTALSLLSVGFVQWFFLSDTARGFQFTQISADRQYSSKTIWICVASMVNLIILSIVYGIITMATRQDSVLVWVGPIFLLPFGISFALISRGIVCNAYDVSMQGRVHSGLDFLGKISSLTGLVICGVALVFLTGFRLERGTDDFLFGLFVLAILIFL